MRVLSEGYGIRVTRDVGGVKGIRRGLRVDTTVNHSIDWWIPICLSMPRLSPGAGPEEIAGPAVEMNERPRYDTGEEV